MKKFNWRVATFAAILTAAGAGYALAENTSNSGQSKSKSESSQNSNNDANQGQSQAKNNDNSNSNNNANSAQSKESKSSSDNSNSRDQSKQDQRNQNNADRSNSNSASGERSSARSQERDSVRSENNDERSTSRDRDRSSRDYDRNGENRSSNSSKDSSRERSSHRDNMRGPDIGIWFSRSSRDSLVISDVSSRGAVAKLGFREGDRIVSVNGRRVTREDEFLNYLLHGDARRVKVIVLRDSREEIIYVEPAVLTDEYEYTEVDPLERFGIVVDDRYDDRIVVWRVIPRSPAYYAGFRPGDVIVTFNGRPYKTRTEFERGSRYWKTGAVGVQIRRGDRTRDLSVEIPNADRADKRNSTTSDQSSTDRTSTERSDNKSSNDQRNNNRGGILNGSGLGRGNR